MSSRRARLERQATRRAVVELDTNGVLARCERVQRFLDDWGDRLISPRFMGREVDERLLADMERDAGVVVAQELEPRHTVGVRVRAFARGTRVELRAVPDEDAQRRAAARAKRLVENRN